MSQSQNMDSTSKLHAINGNRIRQKYAYTIPETRICRMENGVPIILSGRSAYVCGGCLLLLQRLDVHFLSHSRFEEMPLTQPMQTIPFAASRCGCEVSTLWQNHYLSPSSLQREESTFMGFCLTCQCILEIKEKVDGLFPTVPNGRIEHSPNYGWSALLMSDKLTGLTDWHFISPSTSLKEPEK